MKRVPEYLKQFFIPISGMSDGTRSYQFEVDNRLFESLAELDDKYSLFELEKSQLNVSVSMIKRGNLFDFDFDLSGAVTAACDRCLEPVEINLEDHQRLLYKFGPVAEIETDGEIVILPESEYQIDLSHPIYEFTNFALPLKRTHQEGECNADVVSNLSTHKKKNEDEIDPRWAALKNFSNK